MTKRMPLYLLPAFLALYAVQASARVQTTYDGCVDMSGTRVRAISDATLATVVEARIERGVAEIRHNPDHLPRQLPASRDFLFAHECARINVGLPIGPARSERDARKADCEAVAMLLRSDLVDDNTLAAIEADLGLSPPECGRSRVGAHLRADLMCPGTPSTTFARVTPDADDLECLRAKLRRAPAHLRLGLRLR